jgi:hypothetical protein
LLRDFTIRNNQIKGTLPDPDEFFGPCEAPLGPALPPPLHSIIPSLIPSVPPINLEGITNTTNTTNTTNSTNFPTRPTISLLIDRYAPNLFRFESIFLTYGLDINFDADTLLQEKVFPLYFRLLIYQIIYSVDH